MLSLSFWQPFTAGQAQVMTTVAMPGRPFAAVASARGDIIFISLSGRGIGKGAVAVLKRQATEYEVEHVIQIGGQPAGLALSHDERYLAVADGRETLLLDSERLKTGEGDPVKSSFVNEQAAIGVAFSPDDRVLAITEEIAGRLTLINLARPESSTHLNTDRAPVGLAFSPDGAWLYVTSEVDDNLSEKRCRSETGDGFVSQGTVSTVNMHAPDNPALSARVAVGCGPVRILVTHNGTQALVSLRGENRVAVVPTAELRAGSSLRTATINVGPSPVGMALAADGRTLLIANSNRFDPRAAGSVSCVHLNRDGNLADVSGLVLSGRFPREVTALPDNAGFAVTLFGSRELQVLPAEC